MPPNYLLGCDWGTSSFRLQLLNTADYQSVGQLYSAAGVAGTFNAWRASGESQGIPRASFFRRQLRQQIDQLAATLSMRLTNVPVVISGMASSSIGMELLPYAPLPFGLNGGQAVVRHDKPCLHFPHPTLLISGVSSQTDVMRGEETQLIGLTTLLTASGQLPDDATYIFPGTHSKHMHIRNGQLVQFDTYLTGEVFDLMAHRSILNDSVDTHDLADFSADHVQAFQQGVWQSAESVLLNNLFRVRTNGLFGKLPKAENAFYLSGLLIGSELHPLCEKVAGQIVLCSGHKLAEFYKLALDSLQLTDRTMPIPVHIMEQAAGVGQIRLYQQQVVNQPPL